MERKVAWNGRSDEDLVALEQLAAEYREFISQNKTERECTKAAIAAAEAAGYKPLSEAIAGELPLQPGDKVWAHAKGKAIILVHVGRAPMAQGLNILGAHIDSPRLDI